MKLPPSPPSSCATAASTATLLPEGYELHEGSFELAAPLQLHFSGRLEHVRLAYRLAGAPGAPVVAALGGISGGRNVWARQAR